jgi:DNA helicase-2/ATP-dependent DNA helicase PcrA
LNELDPNFVKMAKPANAPKEVSSFRPVQKTGFTSKPAPSAAQLIQKPTTNTNYQHVVSANFQATDALALAAGQKVEHAKFGFGLIKRIEVNGAERKAVIDFEKGVGEKTLLLSFAKLMIVT